MAFHTTSKIPLSQSLIRSFRSTGLSKYNYIPGTHLIYTSIQLLELLLQKYICLGINSSQQKQNTVKSQQNGTFQV